MNLPTLLTRNDIITTYRSRIAAGNRSKLSANELESLIEDFVTRLATAGTELEIRSLCDEELALLEEGYLQRTLASDYLPKYRRAIALAIELGRLPLTAGNSHSYTHIQRVTGVKEERSEHYGLTFLKYDAETYEALDTRSKLTNRAKQLELQAVNPWRYLEALEGLLAATDGFVERKQAIALAGLTGRRIGEIVQRGQFALGSHPYLLRFEGHSKTDRAAYEIVTLLPADRVLAAIDEFRAMPEILPLRKMQGEELAGALNKLDVQINRVMEQELNEIVPPLPGRKGISVHNLRSLWGAIACYFFCPPNAHEYAFLQHYLGHVMESSATGHYFRYQLVNEKGKLLNVRGVKLASVPQLPIEEAEREPKAEGTKQRAEGTEQPAAQVGQPTHRKRGSLRIAGEERDRWNHLLDTLCPECPNQTEKTSALLNWAEQQQLDRSPLPSAAADPSEVPTPAPEPQPQPQAEALETITLQAQTLAFLSGEVENLRRQVEELQRERDQARTEAAEAGQIKETIAQLQQNRAAAQQEADRLRNTLKAYLDGDGTPAARPPQTSTATAQPTTADSPPATATSIRTTRRGSAFDRAQRIVERIMQWNQENPNDTWAITPGLLESTFGINRKALHSFLQEYQQKIDDHHRAIGVQNARGHNRRKDDRTLKEWVENAP